MENNTKKILTTTAVAAATLAAGTVVVTNNVHAATAEPNANEATNDQLAQAKQKVTDATNAQQTAQAADDQAATELNNAQKDADAKQTANDNAQKSLSNDSQAVDQATTALNSATANQSAVSNAIANHDKAQADLNNAEASQAAVAQENADGHLDQAVSDAQSAASSAQTNYDSAQSANSQAQTDLNNAQQALSNAAQTPEGTTRSDVDAAQSAKDTAQQAKDAADQQVSADSDAVQSATDEANQAQTDANTADTNYNNASDAVNTKQAAYDQAKQNLQNAQSQSGSTETAKKNVADILWIPSNFGTVMRGAFDEGAHLTDEQVNMLKELYTKNVNAFTDHMDDIMTDADYDTTYDLSGRSYNVTDKQGHGINAQAELEVFAADILNTFRSKLGMPLFKVNSIVNTLTNYYDYDDHSVTPPTDINFNSLDTLGQSSAHLEYGVTQAYPIMDEPNTYPMDQLKYNLFLQLMQIAFEDNSSIQTQGDHAATVLGTSLHNTNASQASNQYITVVLQDDGTTTTASLALGPSSAIQIA